mgnify:CR=1 FL=1|tara:strand:+ start:3066 stop:7403 length:4338 start_codon:yes stop_codon:yes gene_type:complete
MTLESTSAIKMLDLLCEGEIEGWGVDGNPKKSTFLNDTPLQQADGTDNFDPNDVNVSLLHGTDNQTVPDNGAFTSSIVNVGTEVGANYSEELKADGTVESRNYGGGSVSRTITDTAVKKFKCLFTISRLFSTAVDGLAQNQLFNATICLEVTAKGPKGSISAKKGRMQITGITTSSYQFETEEFEIADQCGHPCTVTVKKLDYIYIKNEIANNRFFDSYTYKPAVFPDDKDTAIKSNDNKFELGAPPRGNEAIFEANLYGIDDDNVATFETRNTVSYQNKRGNQLIWTSLIQDVPSNVSYDFSACASLSISTKSFPTLPRRSYLIKGTKVQIPSNMSARADGSLQVTQGVDFDGEGGQTVWTTCPVCIFRHMLLNTRFGAGDFVRAENVSWVDLYPLIRYANEEILSEPTEAAYSANFNSTSGQSHPNRINITVGADHGYTTTSPNNIIKVFFKDGGLLATPAEIVTYTVIATNATQVAVQVRSDQQTNTSGGNCLVAKVSEPRFACNVAISGQAEAFNVLQDLASVFRGMLYYQTNGIFAAADHGELGKVGALSSSVPPVHIFNNSNVVGGEFEYEGTSIKTRSTTVKVRFNNVNNLYRPDFVCVENAALREKYGHQVRDIVGFGCTSKGQAARLGRWMLASEELDSDIVKFAVGLDGGVVLPGQVFAISDEMRAGTRIAGRVRSATTTAVTLDANVTLPSGSGSELTCVLNDGTVETKGFDPNSSTVANGVRTIVVSSAFSEAPQPQSVYSISTSTVAEQKYKCLAVADNGDGTYAIVGVQHNDSIYEVADVAGNELYEEPVSTYTSNPSPPENLNITFRPVQTSGNLLFQALISWDRGATGVTTGYHLTVTSTTSSNEYDLTPQFKEVGAELFIPANSPLTARVCAFDLDGKKGKIVKTTITSPDAGILQSAKFIPAQDVTLDPPSITGLSVRTTSEVLAQVDFDPVNLTKEVLTQHRVVIRYSATASSWGQTTFVKEVSATETSIIVPYRPGVYYAKLRDIGTNRQSATAAQVAVTDVSDVPKLLVKTMPYGNGTDGVVDAGSFVIGESYKIVSLGTNFESIGAIANVVGTRFVATGQGSGTGTATQLLDDFTIREDFPQDHNNQRFAGEFNTDIVTEGSGSSTKLTLGVGPSTTQQATGTYTQSGYAMTVSSRLGFNVDDNVYLIPTGPAYYDMFITINNVTRLRPFRVVSVTDSSFTVTSPQSRSVTDATEVFVVAGTNTGTYHFHNEVDMEGQYEVILKAIAKNETEDAALGVTNVQLYFRTSLDAPSTDDIADEAGSDKIIYEDNDLMLTDASTITFTDWKPFTAVFATGRVFQFKAELTTKRTGIIPKISQLGVDVQLLQRVETAEATSSLTATDNFRRYVNSFYEVPALSAELKQASSNTDTDRLITFPYSPFIGLSQVPAGEAYYIRAVNSSNINVVRTYRYTATGFGKKLPAN